jgi:hypothetical protein
MRARPLTAVSLEKLSVGLTSAVSELTGEHYSAEITQINFESEPNSWMHDTTVLTLRLKASNCWWMSDDTALVAPDDEPEA